MEHPEVTAKDRELKGQVAGPPAFPSLEGKGLGFHAKKSGLDPTFNGKAWEEFCISFLPSFFLNLILVKKKSKPSSHL